MRALLPLLLLLVSGCESLRFYQQAVQGQVALLLGRESVVSLLAEPGLSAERRLQLERSQTLLGFIERELGLQPERRYRTYVELDRDAVVYNLVATPRLSVAPRVWCYPVAGCAPYRGYFNEAQARAAVSRYQQRGYTTYLGRVPAYSTLGWFADPLLSTFIHWDEPRLLNLMAHELAHSRVWIKGAVAFNEAFASFVGDQAVRSYYGASEVARYQAFQRREAEWQRLVSMLLELRSALAKLYAEPATGVASERRKAQRRDATYAHYRSCYAAHRDALGEGRFDAYLAALNDAALAAVATYQADRPAFAVLFADSGGDWGQFFQAVEALGERPEQDRVAALAALNRRAALSGGGADALTAEQPLPVAAALPDVVRCRAPSGGRD